MTKAVETNVPVIAIVPQPSRNPPLKKRGRPPTGKKNVATLAAIIETATKVVRQKV
jgi:hypothetical protein